MTLLIEASVLEAGLANLNVTGFSNTVRIQSAISDTIGFDEITTGLPGSQFAAWGDYDKDGDLDILLLGGTSGDVILSSRVFRNDTGTFHDVGISLIRGTNGGWGDFDNDGDLDIIISGPNLPNNQNCITEIYHNEDGSFIDSDAGIIGVNGDISWMDYDNDNDLDVFVTGSPDNGSTFIVRLYRNDSGSFVQVFTNLPALWASKAVWGDYDNDGDADVAISGYGQAYITKIYKNNHGSFVETYSLQALSQSALAWGDYDNDGDLDLLVSGDPPGALNYFTTIYRNDVGHFVNLQPNLTQMSVEDMNWGDYDQDGDLDIVMSGKIATGYKTIIYRNDNGDFVDINATITGTWFSSVQWGDYDNDGDPDILLAGLITSGDPLQFVTKIYRNDAGVNRFSPNTPPEEPEGLSALIRRTTVTLAWNPSTDAQTASSGLSYNIFIGDSNTVANKMNPMSNLVTGMRKIAHLGNVNQNIRWSIYGLPAGTYYWSVQAIDNSYEGSTFSEIQNFEIPGSAPKILSVKDIPADQGGSVLVRWRASTLDTNVNDLTHYSIWRALPAMSNGIEKNSFLNQISKRNKETAYRFVELNGTLFAWEWVGNQDAHRFDEYAFTVPTFNDSISGNDGKLYLLVSAHTTDPNFFFDSSPDSGYSIDNISPHTPVNLKATLQGMNSIIEWAANTDPDLKEYVVYRSSSPTLTINNNPWVHSIEDTVFIDEGPFLPESRYYYFVVAIDIHGNRSVSASRIAIESSPVVIRNAEKPVMSGLLQNYPNPFNPSTRIGFDLSYRGHVSLKVYNTLGQEVANLLEEHLDAGGYEVTFDGSELLSGVYFYRLLIADEEAGRTMFSAVRKLMLVK